MSANSLVSFPKGMFTHKSQLQHKKCQPVESFVTQGQIKQPVCELQAQDREEMCACLADSQGRLQEFWSAQHAASI